MPARRSIAAALAAPLLPAGCASPLATMQSDYGLMTPDDELAAIRTLRLTAADGSGAPEADDVSSEPPREGERATPAIEVASDADAVALTLEEARAAALEHNLAVRVALVNPSIANQSVTEEEAAFEAVFRVTGVTQNTDTPTSSTLDDAQQTFRSLNPELVIPTRLGGEVTIAAPLTRSETTNQFATLNPAFTQDLEFSISQPLLRGAGRRTTMAGLKIASLDRQISLARTKLDVIAQLAAVDRAYWRLYADREEVAVRIQQRELAEQQLERARNELAAGRVAEIEVVRAESGVADQVEAILAARNRARASQRELKRLLNLPGLPVDGEASVELATTPDPALYAYDPEAMLRTALGSRMELLETELQLAQDLVRIDLAENAALPQLDLAALYRINGLGDGFIDAAETTVQNRFEDWRLSVTASLPLGNEAALAGVRRAVLARLQRIATRQDREQTIRQDVLDAIDTLTTSWQRVLAARERVRLSTRTLRAEERQFSVGRSTSTDVLDANSRLADARLNEVSAVVDYQVAQVDLAQSTGTLLGQARVDLRTPGDPDLDGWWYAPRDPGTQGVTSPSERLTRPPTVGERFGRREPQPSG